MSPASTVALRALLLLGCLAGCSQCVTLAASDDPYASAYQTVSVQLKFMCDVLLNKAPTSFGDLTGVEAAKKLQGLSVESCTVDGLTVTGIVAQDLGQFMRRNVCTFRVNSTGYLHCILQLRDQSNCAMPAAEQTCAVKFPYFGTRQIVAIACSVAGLALACCIAVGLAVLIVRKRRQFTALAGDDTSALVA